MSNCRKFAEMKKLRCACSEKWVENYEGPVAGFLLTASWRKRSTRFLTTVIWRWSMFSLPERVCHFAGRWHGEVRYILILRRCRTDWMLADVGLVITVRRRHVLSGIPRGKLEPPFRPAGRVSAAYHLEIWFCSEAYRIVLYDGVFCGRIGKWTAGNVSRLRRCTARRAMSDLSGLEARSAIFQSYRHAAPGRDSHLPPSGFGSLE